MIQYQTVLLLRRISMFTCVLGFLFSSCSFSTKQCNPSDCKKGEICDPTKGCVLEPSQQITKKSCPPMDTVPGNWACRDGKWVDVCDADEDCEKGYFCSQGGCQTCLKPLCFLGARKCEGNKVQVCVQSNGCNVWKTQSHCAEKQVCQRGHCGFSCKTAQECPSSIPYCSDGLCQGRPWGVSFGANSLSDGQGSVVDKEGNIYLLGNFAGSELKMGHITLKSSGKSDVFLAKLSPSGQVKWATSFGGVADEYGQAVTLDNAGNVYVLGTFLSSSLKIGSKTLKNRYERLNLKGNATLDSFVVKLNNQGKVVWTTSFGGEFQDVAKAMAIGADGALYITGSLTSYSMFVGDDFQSPVASKQHTYDHNHHDGFVLKLDANGKSVWGHVFHSNIKAQGTSVLLDGKGNLFLAGTFSGKVGLTSPSHKAGGQDDIFLTSMTEKGKLTWFKVFGGVDREEAKDLVISPSGDLYLLGNSASKTWSLQGQKLVNHGITKFSQTKDAFLAVFSSQGSLHWAKTFGGDENDHGNSLAVGPSGEIFMTGVSFSKQITFGKIKLDNDKLQSGNAFVVKLDLIGNTTWAVGFGGELTDTGSSIALDASGNIVVAGTFLSSNIKLHQQTLTNHGGDVFVMKLARDGKLP